MNPSDLPVPELFGVVQIQALAESLNAITGKSVTQDEWLDCVFPHGK